MSLFDCIDRAMALPPGDGGMDRERGQMAQELFRRLEAEYTPSMGASAAAAQAAADVKRIIRENTELKRRLVLKQIHTQRRIAADLDNYRSIFGEEDLAGGLIALIENDQAARFTNVRATREGLRARYHRMIAGVLNRHSRDILGRVRRRSGVKTIVRELMGENTGDASARELASAVSAAFEQARLDFNAAGGHIGNLEDFGLPHSHDAARIRRDGFNAWAAAIMPRLDWAKIPDFETGRPFTGSSQARRRAFLREIFDDITTDGWSKREPSFAARGRALYNRRADHRVLHFRAADDWLAYNEAFGRSDPFSAIVAHLDGMARDTALMRVLGPNPKGGLEFAIQHMAKRAALNPWPLSKNARGWFRDKDAVDQVKNRANVAKRMLSLIVGQPTGSQGWAEIMSTQRAFLVAAQLGGAMLSAVGDVGFGGLAARHVGMGVTRPLMRQLRLMASSGEREAALRMGVVADMAANTGVAAARYMMDGTPPAVAERLSDAVLRLSYLTQWTEYGRHAFTLEFSAFMAENVGRQWEELPDPLRRLFLERRGFTAADWNAIRSTPLHATQEGASFLIPDDIRFRTDLDPEYAEGLALRLSSAVLEHVEFAVPSVTLRGRALILGDTQAGTIAGEFMRSVAGYRGFALSILFNNLRRVMMAETRDPRLVAIGAFIAITTAAGALSIQLKEIAKGRDPREMDDPKFWKAAALQGGGLGIFGDFVTASENRFGGSLGETVGGAGFAFFDDMLSFTLGNALQLAEGEDTNAGREFTKLLRQYTPGANLWYLTAASQRLGFDMLQRALDPEAEEAWRRAERRRVKDYGNESWWRPGELGPRRAPDLAAAAGG
jgi:hypothetical protein